MKVLGSDGQHVGIVDCVKEDKIILTKSDPASGGKHHSIPADWVTAIEEDEVRLNQPAEVARTNWLDAEGSGGQADSAVCP